MAIDIARNGRFMTAWRMLRPFTLTASVVPTLIGSGLALAEGHWHWALFASFLAASVLIQAATNLFNEYFDYDRGLDSEEMVGIAGTIVHDGVRPRTVLNLAFGFVGLAVLLGLYICATTSWWVAVVGAGCLLVSYGYSGGPKPLSYTPFGELAAALAMGPVIVILAYYIQVGAISWRAVAASVPVGLLIGAILLGNNLRDMELDRAGGRRTLPILLGRRRGSVVLAAVFVLAYLVVIALAGLRVLPLWALLVLLTVPQAVRVARMFFGITEPKQLHPAVKGIALLLFRFGGLIFVGLLLSLRIRA